MCLLDILQIIAHRMWDGIIVKSACNFFFGIINNMKTIIDKRGPCRALDCDNCISGKKISSSLSTL